MRTIQSSVIGDRQIDMISALPLEISTSIFRMLDPGSMHSAMRVCKTWYSLYRSDPQLRRTLRRQVRERKEQRLLLIHNLTVKRSDSWFRTELPQACIRLGKVLPPKLKKQKKAKTGHQIRAKPLRIWFTLSESWPQEEDYPPQVHDDTKRKAPGHGRHSEQGLWMPAMTGCLFFCSIYFSAGSSFPFILNSCDYRILDCKLCAVVKIFLFNA